MSRSHVLLLAMALAIYAIAATHLSRSTPDFERVAELTCAIHALVCRHAKDGQATTLSFSQENAPFASLNVRIRDGLAHVSYLKVGEYLCAGPYRRFVIEPTGVVSRFSSERSWRHAAIVPQLTTLLDDLRQVKPSVEVSRVHPEDH